MVLTMDHGMITSFHTCFDKGGKQWNRSFRQKLRRLMVACPIQSTFDQHQVICILCLIRISVVCFTFRPSNEQYWLLGSILLLIN